MFVNSRAETSVRGREGTAKTDMVVRKTGSDPCPPGGIYINPEYSTERGIPNPNHPTTPAHSWICSKKHKNAECFYPPHPPEDGQWAPGEKELVNNPTSGASRPLSILTCPNILDVSWLSVLKPDSPGCQVAACLREWCCHSSLDPGTGLVCGTSGVWMCGTTMVWYVCMVWYVVCVPIVLLSSPQAPILRPNTKPYSTYWCIMPRPCTLVVLKLQHLSDAAWAAFVP